MKRILIPVDFSNHAREAARLGFAIAHRTHARVSLFHALGLLEHLVIPPQVREQHVRDASRKCERQLDEWRAEELEEGGKAVACEILVRSAEPVQGILHQAAEWNADLIVMGSLGAEGAGRTMFGSVAARVARDAACPVLVVRSDQASRISPDGVFRNPMVAIDYSKFSLPAVELAAELGAEGRTVELVHVFLAPELTGAELADALAAARTEELERLERFAGRVDEVPVAVKLRSQGAHVAGQLLDYLASSPIDLLVLGAHGRDEDVAIIGTVADRILRTSPVPVAVIPDAAVA